MHGEMKDWEEAVKYQIAFWKLFTLSPFIATILFILMVVGVISIYETGINITEPAIEPMPMEPVRIG
jgi:hypothetical protein